MIRLFRVHMPESVVEPLKDTLLSGYIGQGPRVDEFEELLGPWFGSQNVLTVNSGTSAIHLALRLAGVGYGDSVISTPMTCAATNEPILERGARIIWADIVKTTGEIDADDVAEKIEASTKAIVVVHWGGYPCNLDRLNRIASRRGVKVIEDAAHAFGSAYRGNHIGSHSDFVCFSFQAIKTMTTVDGGALVCRSREDYRRAKLLRWYGLDREKRSSFRCEDDIPEHGYKFHMNDVCATVGIEQLRHVGGLIRAQTCNASYYDRRFRDLHAVVLPSYEPDRLSSYWLYTLLVEERSEFVRHMTAAGVEVSEVHSRNDTYTMMKEFRSERLPGVDYFASRHVSIPVGWWLTRDEREHIASAVEGFCGLVQGDT